MRIKKNLDILLYEKIRDSFLKGDYRLGEKIDIDELADKYEVSRTPIIQAIKRFENEGMMETGRGGKIMIPQYTPSKIREIYDIRILLEEYAMKNICISDRKIDFVKMRKYANECKEGYDGNDVVSASKADLLFHYAIVKSVGNDSLTDIYHKVQGQCMVVNYLLANSTQHHRECCCSEHEGIIESLNQTDFEKSCAVLEHHLNRNVKRLLSALPSAEITEDE